MSVFDIPYKVIYNKQKIRFLDFTDDLIVFQAFIFFVAGYETLSTVMTNTLYELAQNQKIQDRLREEIHEEYTKRGGNLTYENIKKMNYLDKVFKDTSFEKKIEIVKGT